MKTGGRARRAGLEDKGVGRLPKLQPWNLPLMFGHVTTCLVMVIPGYAPQPASLVRQKAMVPVVSGVFGISWHGGSPVELG